MNAERFDDEVEALNAKLQAKLGVRGKTLARRLSRAGRRLPKPVQAAGRVITTSQTLMHDPRLQRMVQDGEVDAAFATVNGHLKGIDRSEDRKDAALGLAGSVVFNLILVVTLVVVVMRWRGLI